MIAYERKTLANGLTVAVNRDRASKLAAVNLALRSAPATKNPARTGFAHLFEHLMFRGTRDVPNFDLPVQMASGDNNAFTNNDYTDFYITLPKDNIETALWLESDRMEGLDITTGKLETEKRVVIEEFRQRYLNQPYGDQPMLLRALAYKVHPLPLGRHRADDRAHRLRHTGRCRGLLPPPLPSVERRALDLGRPGGGADDGAGREVVRRARRHAPRRGTDSAGAAPAGAAPRRSSATCRQRP